MNTRLQIFVPAKSIQAHVSLGSYPDSYQRGDLDMQESSFDNTQWHLLSLRT